MGSFQLMSPIGGSAWTSLWKLLLACTYPSIFPLCVDHSLCISWWFLSHLLRTSHVNAWSTPHKNTCDHTEVEQKPEAGHIGTQVSRIHTLLTASVLFTLFVTFVDSAGA